MDILAGALDDGPMAMTTRALRWTHLTQDSLEAWAELTRVLADADGTDEVYAAEDLAEELAETGLTPETDTWGVWDDDRLVAYGQLRVSLTLDHDDRVRCHLSGGVHPDWRGRGIGGALMDRMEPRALALARERHPGVPAYLRATGGIEGSSARRMLARRGYAVVRYFNDLARPVPEQTLPELPVDGAVIVTSTDEHAEAVRVAHNNAFADHWGSAEIPAEQWHHHWASRAGRGDLSSLALAPDGSVLAYVLAAQWVPRTLYITIVGTVPAARGRGLAAACLARTMNLAAQTGEFDTVQLDVDSDSPTGAVQLYERLGFQTTRVFASMQRDAPLP